VQGPLEGTVDLLDEGVEVVGAGLQQPQPPADEEVPAAAGLLDGLGRGGREMGGGEVGEVLDRGDALLGGEGDGALLVLPGPALPGEERAEERSGWALKPWVVRAAGSKPSSPGWRPSPSAVRAVASSRSGSEPAPGSKTSAEASPPAAATRPWFAISRLWS